jgi:hypothetical protein
MPTLDSFVDDPADANGYIGDITFAGNMGDNPFSFDAVKNNKRKQTGPQPIALLSFNNPFATVYMEPHTGIICSSCNLPDSIYMDGDSHTRGCNDRKPHLRLSNGFIHESKVGVVGADGTRTFPAPFFLTGQDYRQVRDLCGLSSDLITRQDAFWTPSMPIQEGDGKPTYKSYRWHYTFMTKTVNMRQKQYGLPLPLYGDRHNAIRQANAVAANITEAITAAEAAIVAPRAALTAAQQEIVQLKAYKTGAEQEIVQLKSDKAGAKVIKTNLRKRLKDACSALRSTQALLDAANKRLVENDLDPVKAKAAPTTNGTDGTEETPPDNLNEVTQDSIELEEGEEVEV